MKTKFKIITEFLILGLVSWNASPIVCAIKKWAGFMGTMWNTTTKKSRNVISVLSVVTLLCLAAGCNGPGTEFVSGKMETPSAVRHIEWVSCHHPDNLARHQLGAIRGSGEIIEITEFGKMSSQIMPDLWGVAFTIDLDDQWGSGIFGDDFNEELGYMYVFEFTFPKATYPNGTRLYWSVNPILYCPYRIQESDILTPSYEDTSKSDLWINYVVVEDPFSTFDLMVTDDTLMSAVLEGGIEDEKEYCFTGASYGSVRAFHDKRNGTMILPAGAEAKLFIGVSVLMMTNDQYDRIRVGGDSLPTNVSNVSGLDYCYMYFDGYYTMYPVAIDE